MSVVPPVVGQREHNRQRDEDAQCECRSEKRAGDPQQRDNQLNPETPHNVAPLADSRLFCNMRTVRDEPHTCQRGRTRGEIGTIHCERHRREGVKPSGTLMATVPAGTVLNVVGESNGWLQVRLPKDSQGFERLGYILASLTRPIESFGSSPQQTSKPSTKPNAATAGDARAQTSDSEPSTEAAAADASEKPIVQRTADKFKKIKRLWSSGDDKKIAEPDAPKASDPPSQPQGGRTIESYRIFVKAESDSAGFADQELQDSVRGVKNGAKAPSFVVSSNEAEANVMLVVVKRETKVGTPKHNQVYSALAKKGVEQINDVYAALSIKRAGRWTPGIKLSRN